MAPARSFVLAAVLVAALAPAAGATPQRLFDSPSLVLDAGFLPSAVVAADLNGDGHPDLVILNSWASTLQIELGRGDGTFEPGVSIASGQGANTLSAGDVNGDGALDLLVPHVSADGVDLLLGNGDGTFQPPVRLSCNAGTRCAVLADVDGDGKLDIAAGCITPKISIFVGNGDGTFQPRIDTTNPQIPASIVVADLDEDGDGDVIVSNDNQPGISVWKSAGTGGIGLRTDYATPTRVTQLAVANVMGTSHLDVLAAEPGPSVDGVSQPDGAARVSIFPGLGNGSFGARQDLTGLTNTLSVTVVDLDGDGHLDLAVTEGPENGGSIHTFLGDGSGGFASAGNLPIEVRPMNLAAADFDGDGNVDLASAEWNSSSASVVLGNGDGTFGFLRAYATGASPHGLAIADLDGDGAGDLVVANGLDSTVSVFHGVGDGTFGPRTDLAVGSWPWGIAIADLNGDGKADLAVSDSLGDAVSILLGHGDGTFAAHVESAADDGPRGLAIGDVDLDGVPDLVVAASGAKAVSVLKGAGGGTFSTIGSIPLANRPHAVAIGLFDGDVWPDLAVAVSTSGQVAVARGLGGGAFTAPVFYPTTVGAEKVAIADVDGDGVRDLVVTGFGTAWLRGLGDGTFAAAVKLPGGGGSGLVVTDLDHDGSLDIAAATLGGWIPVMRGLGAAAFEPAINYGAAGAAFDVAALPRTGGVDLVVTEPMSNRVVVMRNRGASNTGVPLPRAASTVQLALAPRPARDAMHVSFTLPRAGDVRLAAYDLSGRRVATLLQGAQAAGAHEVPWRVGALKAGLYFVVLETGGQRAVTRAVVAH